MTYKEDIKSIQRVFEGIFRAQTGQRLDRVQGWVMGKVIKGTFSEL